MREEVDVFIEVIDGEIESVRVVGNPNIAKMITCYELDDNVTHLRRMVE